MYLINAAHTAAHGLHVSAEKIAGLMADRWVEQAS